MPVIFKFELFGFTRAFLISFMFGRGDYFTAVKLRSAPVGPAAFTLDKLPTPFGHRVASVSLHRAIRVFFEDACARAAKLVTEIEFVNIEAFGRRDVAGTSEFTCAVGETRFNGVLATTKKKTAADPDALPCGLVIDDELVEHDSKKGKKDMDLDCGSDTSADKLHEFDEMPVHSFQWPEK